MKMPAKNKRKKVTVLGAGVTGLSAAWKLSPYFDVEVIERAGRVGGLATSFKYKDYILDYGPHKIYTQIPGVLNEYKALLGDDLLTVPKKSKLRLNGKLIDFPVRMSQVVGAVGMVKSALLGFGFAIAILKRFIGKKKPVSYKDFIVKRFGNAAYNLVFRGYAQKVWGDPRGLSAEAARIRVPQTGLFQMVKGMVFGVKNDPSFSADEFYYPKKGIIEVSNRMADIIKKNRGKIVLGATVTGLRLKGKRVVGIEYSDGKAKRLSKTDSVVSTLPLNILLRLMKAPERMIEEAEKLKTRSLVLLYLFFDKPRIINANWTFFPEPQFIFNRLSEQKSFSPYTVPENKSVMVAEISCDFNDRLWNDPDREIMELVAKDLEKAGIMRREEIRDYFTVKLKDIYPIYLIGYEQNLGEIVEYLDGFENLISIGRSGLFNYNNTDHCLDMGRTAASHIISGRGIEGWKMARQKFKTYTIGD